MFQHPDERALVAGSLARGIRPLQPLPFSQWLPQNIVLVDGPHAGQMWSAHNAPYLLEIADCLSDDHPCTEVDIRKSQQSGASILALAWKLYCADREPANMLYGCPGIDALRDMNSGKLQPLIDAWHKKIGRTVIMPNTQRSGAGSTTYEKKFAGGILWLANANAVMDLSSKTVRKGVRDEVSKWQDIPGFGDPETLFFGRFTAFRRLKNYKILNISTPEVDSGAETGEEKDDHCRIDRRFRRSDQRFWHVPCPACGAMFAHEIAQLRIDEAHPHRSTYECPHCQHRISESERVQAVRLGEWRASNPAGDHPGFHIDAFISLMMSYEAIAEDEIAARKSEKARKDFHNLVLGLPYRFRGDAPDHERLMDRREDLTRGHVPARGLILTAYVDVQMRGVWYAVIAHAPSGETWLVDANYIEGDTDKFDAPVFAQVVREIVDREFPDAFGRTRRIDALGVDSGYRAHIVYAFVRRNQRLHPDTGRDLILACKGLDGWQRPAIGQPKLVDIDLEGKKIKEGAKLWGIGTWPLKADLYSNLHKRGEDGLYPDGYCHFGKWADENLFKQITAEHLEDVIVRGRSVGRRWVKNGPNHYLDCYIGNFALAEYLGRSAMTDAEWSRLALARGMPPASIEADLFSHRNPEMLPVKEAKVEQPVPVSNPAPAADWIGRATDNWINR